MEVHTDPTGLQLLRVTAREFDASFEVFGNCPVQGVGTVGGRALYFRARHDGWSFEVADHDGGLPSDGSRSSGGFWRENNFPNAGWMSHREAVEIIGRCLSEYVEIDAIGVEI
jgi:hypothetical protein